MNVILGGKEYVISGFGEYEVNKRKTKYLLNDENYSNYYNTKYVYINDVINSILNSQQRSELKNIIIKLASYLENEEKEKLLYSDCAILPALTSHCLFYFVENNFNDLEEIKRINSLLFDYIERMNYNISIKYIPSIDIKYDNKPIDITDNDSISKLEFKLINIINEVEKNKGILVENCYIILSTLLGDNKIDNSKNNYINLIQYIKNK